MNEWIYIYSKNLRRGTVKVSHSFQRHTSYELLIQELHLVLKMKATLCTTAVKWIQRIWRLASLPVVAGWYMLLPQLVNARGISMNDPWSWLLTLAVLLLPFKPQYLIQQNIGIRIIFCLPLSSPRNEAGSCCLQKKASFQNCCT